MGMPGREYKAGTAYRYGFNGKEKDNELSGEGNMYDYGFRIYNSRLGRFLSVDPLMKNYPWFTPYQFAGNCPIQAIDLDGLEDLKLNILSLPTGPDKPGEAKLEISIAYQVVTSGSGKVSSEVSQEAVQKIFNSGTTKFQIDGIPNERYFMTSLDSKYYNILGKLKTDKLKSDNKSYFNLEVQFNVSISNTTTITDAWSNMLKEPVKNGIIFDLPTLKKADRDKLPADLLKIIDFATKVFEEKPEAEGLALNESVIGSLGLTLSKYNVLILNPSWKGEGITASYDEKIAHEIGHNLSDFNHGMNDYQYDQEGLQSNEAGKVKPTMKNILGIFNNYTNMQNTKRVYSKEVLMQIGQAISSVLQSIRF
jgi:RHS repeat-associated protein